MDIIFVTSSDTSSGGSRQALYLAQGLVARGHKLTFFVPKGSSLIPLDDTINWQTLPEKRSNWGEAVEKALPPKDTPVIVHGFHNKAGKMVAWWGAKWRLQGRKAVAIFNRGVVFRPGNPLPYWSPFTDAITANSNAASRVMQRIGTPASRIKVIYNGIPAERTKPTREKQSVYRELEIDPGTLVFGTIAGGNPVKGVEPFMRAIAKANLSSARFVIVGVSPEKWGKLANELNIREQIRFVDHTPNVADYLQMFSVFVLPSLSESMPNTLQEAMMFGLPAIASQVGGVPELVQGNGILVPPGDVDALAEALQTIAQTPKLVDEFSAQSRAMSDRFTIETKVDHMEKLYSSLLLKRGLLYT